MSLVFELKVVPSSGRSKCIWDKSQIIKCYLKSPPEKGLANKELIKLIAKSISVPQCDVVILSGARSRKKRLSINLDISFEQLLDSLEVERQKLLFE